MSAPKWWGKLAALFTDAGADPEKIKEIEAEFSAEEGKQPDPKLVTGATPEQLAALKAEFAAEMAAERRKRLESEAAAFAKEIIVSQKRALPAEFGAIRQQYLDAALDDAASPREVTFGADQKGTRTDALRAAFALRPAHQLTEELMPTDLAALFNRGKTDEKDKPPVIDADAIYKRRREAMNGKEA